MVRVTPQDAQAMKDAYAKMYAPNEEPVETEAAVEKPAVEDEERYPIRDYNP